MKKPNLSKYIKRFMSIFASERSLSDEELKRETAFAKRISKNPYLQSKALWNDMYGDVHSKLKRSNRVNYYLLGVIGFAIIGLVLVSGLAKVKSVPFIIHGNEVLTLNQSADSQAVKLKPQLASYFAKQFIRNARAVSADRNVNRIHKIAAFSFVGDAATQVLKDFYLKNNPDTLAEHRIQSVKITSVLQNAPHSYDIRWQETWRSVSSGELIKTEHYIAEISYRYQKPSQDEVVLRYNPMGFSINQLSWSLDMES